MLLATGVLVSRELISQKRPTLFVFVPSLIRARALVSVLERALPGVEVIAFGRFADFFSAVRSLKPSAALSLQATLNSVGLESALLGTAEGSTEEVYVVLTHHAEITLNNLGDKRIGVVDVVGRTAMPKLTQELLGLSATPRIRRVLKVSDLLPLLSLDLADAIVVPSRLAPSLQKATRLKLIVLRPDSARLGRAAVSYPSGKRVALVEMGLRRLSTAAREALGVDGWEERP